MRAMVLYMMVLDTAESMGLIAANDTSEYVESLLDGVCPDCGAPADECEHACPPTHADHEARRYWREPS